MVREQRDRLFVIMNDGEGMKNADMAMDEREEIARVADTHEYFMTSDEVHKEEFLAWATKLQEERLPTDGRVNVYLGPDGSVYSTSFMKRMPAAVAAVHNHHHPKDDPNTQSSAMQLLNDLQNGRIIQRKEMTRQHVFHKRYDDCDQDVSLYDWLTKNWRRLVTDPALAQRVRRFTELQDLLDVYVGLVPLNLESQDTTVREMIEQNMWVFEPYSRVATKAREMNGDQKRAVIEEIGKRLDLFAEGKAERIKAVTEYKTLSKGNGYIFIEPKGLQARMEICKETRNRIVVCSSKMANGHYRHSIGQVDKRFLSYEDQPLRVNLVSFAAYLNALEGLDPGKDAEHWGGRGDKVLASPKTIGSKFSETELEEMMLDFIEPIPPNKAGTHDELVFHGQEEVRMIESAA